MNEWYLAHICLFCTRIFFIFWRVIPSNSTPFDPSTHSRLRHFSPQPKQSNAQCPLPIAGGLPWTGVGSTALMLAAQNGHAAVVHREPRSHIIPPCFFWNWIAVIFAFKTYLFQVPCSEIVQLWFIRLTIKNDAKKQWLYFWRFVELCSSSH